MAKRRSSRLAEWQYNLDVFWESLVSLANRFDPWVGTAGILLTIAGVLLIERRQYGPLLIQSHSGMLQKYHFLRWIFATSISSLVEDRVGLYSGLSVVILGIFAILRWFSKRGLA